VLERGMMVLLEKQVHLQKDVGAGRVLVKCHGHGDRQDRRLETYLLPERETGRSGRTRDVAISM
jgi:hypothetical protein